MSSSLAIDGGTPVRPTFLPYGHQTIEKIDIEAVTDALKSDFLTTGPTVGAFEKDFAEHVGSREAVVVSNGTAGLHCAMYALGIKPGDEVIVPTMTFAATANAVLMQGATPVFADVNRATLLIDPADVERKITAKTKAVIPVDYAGQPCDYNELKEICTDHTLHLVADACHSLDASYNGKAVGTLADMSIFSFHPVKPITTGEGGMITTENETWAKTMRRFRHHGISMDPELRKEKGVWFYAIEDLGYNYRLTDIQCALGRTQLKRSKEWTAKRQAIAKKYDAAFAMHHAIMPLRKMNDREHAYHLYVIQLRLEGLRVDRDAIFAALRAENIGVNLHYIPVHLHSLYQKRGGKRGDCPNAEAAYDCMLSIPLYTGMSEKDSDDVITAVTKVCDFYKA